MTQENFKQYLAQFFSAQDLATWFTPLVITIYAETSTIAVRFPHIFFERWFLENKAALFTQHANQFFTNFTITFITKESTYAPAVEATTNQQEDTTAKKSVTIAPLSSKTPHPDHTFANFLVNKKNDFPVAAAKEAAQKVYLPPFSPLTIYGQSGCGKTHLVEAMINTIQDTVHFFPFFYGDIEEFLHAFQNRTGAFAEQIKEQAFFIDDVQRITDTESVQKKCIAVIDNLVRANKLVVLTLDMHPEDSKVLLPKLRLRLTSGLVIKLKKPDIEIRRQYVQHMNTEFALGLDKHAVLTLAQRYTDFRTIIGAITRIKAYKLLVNNEHTDITQILGTGEQTKTLTPDYILQVIAEYFSLSVKDIIGKSRNENVINARMATICLFRELMGLSLVQIGHIVGGRNHSSIVYSLKKIKEIKQSNKDMNKVLSQLKKLCTQ